MNLSAGKVLQNGKYVIDTMLGQGGFGITYRATQTYLDQTVVVKTLHDTLRHHTDFQRFQEQFIAEARRLAKCQHPNIVRVFDFFEEDGLSFIVMDYIPGQTLADIVYSSSPLSEAQAIHYISQIGAALSAVHQVGLLHRDIKPHNIMRRQGTDFVVLIDFGIAREFTPGVTQTHTGLLSDGYAPIEQYLAQDKRTPATDIYALAATLYFLLTGTPPVAAPLRDRVPLPNLRQNQPHLSLAVEQAVLKGMAMEAHLRPQTVEAWLALLPRLPGEASATNGTHQPAGMPPQYAAGPNATVTSATLPVVPKPKPAVSAASTPANGVATVAAKTMPTTSNGAAPVKRTQSSGPKPQQWLPQALLLSAAIAAVAGAGMGVALRFSDNGAAPSLLNPDQSFPPKKDWPGSDVPETTTPFAEPESTNGNAPVPEVIAPEVAPEPAEPELPPADEPAPSPLEPPSAEVEPSPVESPSPAPAADPSPIVPEVSLPEPEPPVADPAPVPPAEVAPPPEPAPPAIENSTPSDSSTPLTAPATNP